MGHYAPMPRGRWVLTSLIPFGWVTWAGFLWAGFRTKKPAWVVTGFVYLAITAGTLFLTSLDRNEDGLEDNLGYILMFSAWAVGIVQAFLTRKPYLRRLAIPMPSPLPVLRGRALRGDDQQRDRGGQNAACLHRLSLQNRSSTLASGRGLGNESRYCRAALC